MIAPASPVRRRRIITRRGVMEREEFVAGFPGHSPLIATAYVLLIGAVAEIASYLTLGLVRPAPAVGPAAGGGDLVVPPTAPGTGRGRGPKKGPEEG
ncbi:hypothetical protein ACWD7B_27310 [Streptomyces rubiginosohelvolus]